jgi:hypothetical protein
MRSAVLAVALAVGLPLLGLGADEDAARYLHPDAKFLAGIEMKRIAASSLAAIGQKQLPQPATLSGFDPFVNVTRILVSSPGRRKGDEDSSPQKNTKDAAGEIPFLVVITGQFDLQKLKEIATAEGEVVARYGSVELITPPHGKTTSMHFGLVSPTLLLGGDAISMREAIDRRMLPADPTMNLALRRRAAALAASTDVWMTSTISPEELGAGKAPGLAMFSDVRSMDLAVSLEQGLGLHLTLNTRSRAAAGKLAGAVLALTQFANAKGSDGTDLLKNLSVKDEGAAVVMSLAVDAATLEKGIAQMRSSVEQQTDARKQPEPPPQRRVIKIFGAEGGPIEIPLDPSSP